MRYVPLAILLAAGSCGPVDTDPDPDTDTDNDTSVDTDPQPTNTLSIEQTTITFTQGGATEADCEARFSLSAAEYVGDCQDCDWAFDLTATEQSSDCGALPEQLDDVIPNGTIGFWSTFGNYGSTDVLAFFDVYQDGEESYVYSTLLISSMYDGYSYGSGSFQLQGQTLTWQVSGVDSDGTGDELDDSDSCEVSYETSTLEAALDGQATAGSLPCNEAYADVFDLTVDAGATVSISVDTTADGTAFDPMIRVLDPDGCFVYSPDDSFECAFPPPEYECPGGTFTAQAAGTYQLFVRTLGSCADTTAGGDYALVVTGATATLAQDNAPVYTEGSLTETRMFGTVELPLTSGR